MDVGYGLSSGGLGLCDYVVSAVCYVVVVGLCIGWVGVCGVCRMVGSGVLVIVVGRSPCLRWGVHTRGSGR